MPSIVDKSAQTTIKLCCQSEHAPAIKLERFPKAACAWQSCSRTLLGQRLPEGVVVSSFDEDINSVYLACKVARISAARLGTASCFRLRPASRPYTSWNAARIASSLLSLMKAMAYSRDLPGSQPRTVSKILISTCRVTASQGHSYQKPSGSSGIC